MRVSLGVLNNLVCLPIVVKVAGRYVSRCGGVSCIQDEHIPSPYVSGNSCHGFAVRDICTEDGAGDSATTLLRHAILCLSKGILCASNQDDVFGTGGSEGYGCLLTNTSSLRDC